ncbi:hypothetical protein ACPV5O_21200 [Vibrio maritimus]|uniref:hypothetical protein n=1 Tax=Vibrio maritimus TaxID=990268 RepID=UPI0040685ABD
MSVLPVGNEKVKAGLEASILELDKLIAVELDASKRVRLRDGRTKLSDHLEDAVKRKLTGTSAELDEALKSLEELTKKCKEAKDDAAKVAEAITKVAETVDVVVKIVKKTAELLPLVGL